MEEITLTELLIKIKRYIQKYWIIILVLTIIGAFAGYYKGQKASMKTQYTSSINVSTGLVEQGSKTIDLNSLLAELEVVSQSITDKEWTKQYLNIDSLNIISLSVKPVKYTYTYHKPNYLTLTISTYDKSDFDKVLKGLDYYFNHKSRIKDLYSLDTASKRAAYENWEELSKKNLTWSSNVYEVYKENESIRPVFYYVSNLTAIKESKGSPKKKAMMYAFVFMFLGIALTLGIEIIKYINSIESNEE